MQEPTVDSEPLVEILSNWQADCFSQVAVAERDVDVPLQLHALRQNAVIELVTELH